MAKGAAKATRLTYGLYAKHGMAATARVTNFGRGPSFVGRLRCKGCKMGREATGHVRYLGQSGAAKLLLESDVLIVRGEIKARIARAEITGFGVLDADVWIDTFKGRIVATLGAKEAALWVRAMAKPPPSLADKLGISAAKRVYLWSAVQDQDLQFALKGSTAAMLEGAAMTLSVLDAAADLETIIPRLGSLPFWGITRKGKDSPYSENSLRTEMRAHGWIDTKSCAVSATLSGTRYSLTSGATSRNQS